MAEKIPPQRFGEIEIPFTKEDLERKDFRELTPEEIEQRYFKTAAAPEGIEILRFTDADLRAVFNYRCAHPDCPICRRLREGSD